MAFNLMDMVQKQLGNQVLGQIGGLIGENEDKTRAGVNAAVPSILHGLIHKASTQDGARVLERELDNHDDGILDNFNDLLNPSQSSGVVDKGVGLLTTLMGGGALGSVVNIIAKVSGLGGGSSRSMLGLLMPVVMGVLGRHRKSQGLDLGGLMGFLSEQKSNLPAMPAGLDSALGMTASPGPERTAATRQPAASPSSSGGGSMLAKLLPLAALLGLAFLAWQFIGGRGNEEATDETTPAVTTEGVDISLPGAGSVSLPDGISLPNGISIPSVDLGSLTPDNVGGQVTGLFDSATKTFEGITDADSATAAVPAIEGLTKQFGTLSEGMGVMPEAVRGTVGQQVGGLIPTLQKMIEDKIAAIPAIGPILQPAVAGLMEKLAAFAG